MKSMFSYNGNLCGERVRLGRAMQKPPITQAQLAVKLQLLGLEMTQMMVSRIERLERHVVDAELRAIAIALNVSMDWLVGDTDDPKRM